jgi:hypothetical protein
MLGDGTVAGPIAIGLSSEMVGTITLPGDAAPSLIVSPGSHSAKPGLYLARFVKRDDRGVPIFAKPVEIDHPQGRGKLPLNGTVFTDASGTTWGLWLKKDEILRTTFDVKTMGFVSAPSGALKITGLPGDGGWIAARFAANGRGVRLAIGVKDDIPNKPFDEGVKDWRDPLYRPFDGAGVYRGGWPYITLFLASLPSIDSKGSISAMQASETKREAILNLGNITPVDLGGQHGFLTGSWYGNLAFYPALVDGKLGGKQFIAGPDGLAMRHPTVRPEPLSYPDGASPDLLVGGEGAIYFYRHADGLTYAKPTPALEQNARLYTGSLPVLSAVDWDGDGVMDLVAGNSEGKILWFRNAGTNDAPGFTVGVEIESDGKPIFVQTGYTNVQGPQEARWGYVSPCVADWTGDGLPDIVTSSSTARHDLYKNVGTKTAPKLVGPMPIYCDGLDLHGTWRVRPAVAKVGGSMAYVMLDDQDQFHLYRKIDDQNVRDAGKLTFEDGSPIGANFLSAGGTGRSKITWIDLDRDGRIDLIVGTPRHGSVGDPKTGLPQSLGLKGASVVFLKNIGTNDAPKFAKPSLLKFKGEPIYVGQHECSAAMWDVGQPDGPDLMVSEQEGRVMFYARKDLSW